MKTPFPWYSESRSGGGWFVKLDGEQKFLGKHPDDAPKPKKGRDGRWNPPTAIRDEFYKLMAGFARIKPLARIIDLLQGFSF